MFAFSTIGNLFVFKKKYFEYLNCRWYSIVFWHFIFYYYYEFVFKWIHSLFMYLFIFIVFFITPMNSLEYTYLRQCGFKSFQIHLLRKQQGERRYTGLFWFLIKLTGVSDKFCHVIMYSAAWKLWCWLCPEGKQSKCINLSWSCAYMSANTHSITAS